MLSLLMIPNIPCIEGVSDLGGEVGQRFGFERLAVNEMLERLAPQILHGMVFCQPVREEIAGQRSTSRSGFRPRTQRPCREVISPGCDSGKWSCRSSRYTCERLWNERPDV